MLPKYCLSNLGCLILKLYNMNYLILRVTLLNISDYLNIFIPKKSFVITIIITFLIVRMKVCLSCICAHSVLDFFVPIFHVEIKLHLQTLHYHNHVCHTEFHCQNNLLKSCWYEKTTAPLIKLLLNSSRIY